MAGGRVETADAEVDAFRTRARRLRFDNDETEASYRRWRDERAAPMVVVGMLMLLVAGFGITATGKLLGEPFGDEFVRTISIVSPGFVVSAAFARRAPLHPALMVVVGLTTAVWGCTVLWSLHRALDAAVLGTTAVLLVGLWGLLVLRLPPLLGVTTAIVCAAMHQVMLMTSDESIQGTDAFHSTITWLVVVATLTVSVVVDRSHRTEFAQERVILAQHEVIERERKRADDLLQNILPGSVAERLKSGGGLIADHHESVTVLFADVVGFTPLSARLPAAEVVTLLDEVFHMLDDIVDTHDVEKIKTVGDAYMAVAGAPRPRADHTEAIAEVALDILASLDRYNAKHPDPIEMRIGIATGDAIGGVIGRRRFAYDLWSDTVNTASRMESHGLPGRVQITEATARRLEPAYVVEERGVVDIKGKGPTPTWFLVSRR